MSIRLVGRTRGKLSRFASDCNGSAVVGAGLNLAILSLLAVSIIGIIFAGHQLLVLRDIAVAASRYGALAEIQPGQSEKYALELMRESLPLLHASATSESSGGQLGLSLTATVPLLGAGQLALEAQARASREQFGAPG
jgi:hypothetical protein